MVITLAEMGGAQRQVLDISRELVRQGYEVTIAAGTDYNDLFHSAETGSPRVPVLRLPHLTRSIRLGHDCFAFLEIYRAIKKVKPDLVHAHSSKAGALCAVAAKMVGVKIVFTAHGFVFRENIVWWKKIIFKHIERFASLFRDHVIAVSQSDAIAAIASRVVARDKISVIHNGLNPLLEQKILPATEARALLSQWAGTDLRPYKIVLSIANHYPPKNIPLLVRAFELVVRSVPEARLVSIGDGRERVVCEKIIKDTPILQNKVFLVGKKQTACKILRGADLFAVSSSKEGFPYAILEAKMAGTPIVATRVGGIPEMVRDDDITLVVPQDQEELANAMVRVLRHGAGARPQLSEEFTLAGMVERVLEVYEKVLEK